MIFKLMCTATQKHLGNTSQFLVQTGKPLETYRDVLSEVQSLKNQSYGLWILGPRISLTSGPNAPLSQKLVYKLESVLCVVQQKLRKLQPSHSKLSELHGTRSPSWYDGIHIRQIEL